MQGAVAYWTVGDALFADRLSPVLSRHDSFMCVDIHIPTDIDQLAQLVCKGANIRLFSEEIPTYSDSDKKEPSYLLHSKILLFWFPDRTAELWVGSHNWTNRAILGLNIETSVIFKLDMTSRLFFDAADYLQKIKSVCSGFDLSKIDYYKDLQRYTEERTVPVIEVEAIDAAKLGGQEITIFGTDDADLRELGTVRRKVYLSATESRGKELEFVYPAAITQVGELNSLNPTAGPISFSERRYAFRLGRRFPELLLKRDVSPSVVGAAKYYVTLQLAEHDSTLNFDFPMGREGVWRQTYDDASPLLSRMGAEEMSLLFRGREPKVRTPVMQNREASTALALSDQKTTPGAQFPYKSCPQETLNSKKVSGRKLSSPCGSLSPPEPNPYTIAQFRFLRQEPVYEKHNNQAERTTPRCPSGAQPWGMQSTSGWPHETNSKSSRLTKTCPTTMPRCMTSGLL